MPAVKNRPGAARPRRDSRRCARACHGRVRPKLAQTTRTHL